MTTPQEGWAARVLYLHPGPIPPHQDPRHNALAWLAPWVEGTVIQPTWGTPALRHLCVAEPCTSLGRFRICKLSVDGSRGIAGKAHRMVRAAADLTQTRGGFDAVMTYGALSTGLAGLRIARRLSIPLIVQFPGHPYRGILHGDGHFRRLRSAVAGVVSRYVAKRAASLHLLYPTQLQGLRLQALPPTTLSHDFAVVSSLLSSRAQEVSDEILFMGYPWKLKGVDLLIRAFLLIADRHPTVTLHLVGHCPDRTPFEALAKGHPRVRMTPGVPQLQAQSLMRSCRVFALASRTEGMGRVLLEAMAAGKPIVASRVDGTPHLIRHEENGLLFESENVADLAAQLDRILSDEPLAKRLGEDGRRTVQERYTELHYARAMVGLIYRAVGREPPPDDAFVAPPARDTTD